MMKEVAGRGWCEVTGPQRNGRFVATEQPIGSLDVARMNSTIPSTKASNFIVAFHPPVPRVENFIFPPWKTETVSETSGRQNRLLALGLANGSAGGHRAGSLYEMMYENMFGNLLRKINFKRIGETLGKSIVSIWVIKLKDFGH
ncbi:peptide synthetase [Anopheles sinensis]|uniref:Peptide synthetase n=1 Tax=Anopheles sinensis TaxID=74873 RepID=A0A084WDK5_ANOSI|nr:peptide synthetase [Anopheles sinensis]